VQQLARVRAAQVADARVQLRVCVAALPRLRAARGVAAKDTRPKPAPKRAVSSKPWLLGVWVTNS
jgi:hypothetical protein